MQNKNWTTNILSRIPNKNEKFQNGENQTLFALSTTEDQHISFDIASGGKCLNVQNQIFPMKKMKFK